MKNIFRWYKVIGIAIALAAMIVASPLSAFALEIYPNSLSINTTSVNLTRNQLVGVTNLSANTGDLIRVTLYIVNNTSSGFANGLLQAHLTSGLTYVPGSTVVNNLPYGDGITGSGIMLDTLPQNNATTATFQMRFTPSAGSVQQEQSITGSLAVNGVTYNGGSNYYGLVGSGSSTSAQPVPSSPQPSPSPSPSSVGSGGNVAVLPISSGSSLASALGANTALAAGAPIVAGAFTASTGPQYPWLVYSGITGVVSALIYLIIAVVRKRRPVRQ